MALGTVVSVSDATIRFEVETTISGEMLPSFIDVEIPDTFMGAETRSLRPGDYAVLSLDEGTTLYTIAWGFFKVSSLNMATLEVIDGTLGPGELAAFQWYVNSGGAERDFYFIGENAFVRHSDGTATQLYPPTDEPAEVKPSSDSGTASKVVAARDETTIASEWRYVLIAVALFLAGCLTYRIVRTKQSAG